MDAGASTIWDVTANATYHNDVAGIGRDDDSNLEQKQSKSENSDAIVTMALGSVAGDNQSNANSFSADQSFLIWGNDDGALAALGVTDLPSGIEARLDRAWQVEENGTVSSLRVQIDMSGIEGTSGVGTNDLQQVRLLVDDDGTFASGATIVAPTSFDNTTDVISFDHDFAAGTGFFFSIGSVDATLAPLPIELLSFEVHLDQNVVNLTWTTATETNNDFFTIERSVDALHFEEVLTIAGAGNSDTIINYEATDEQPLAGRTYYRLKQTDFDGTFSYSEISTFFWDVGFEVIEVYPNPVTDESLYLRLGSNQKTAVRINLVDIFGRTYLDRSFAVMSGVTQSLVTLPGLAPGVYYLKVQAATTKVIKVVAK